MITLAAVVKSAGREVVTGTGRAQPRRGTQAAGCIIGAEVAHRLVLRLNGRARFAEFGWHRQLEKRLSQASDPIADQLPTSNDRNRRSLKLVATLTTRAFPSTLTPKWPNFRLERDTTVRTSLITLYDCNVGSPVC